MSDLFMRMSFVMPVPGHYVKPETHKGLKTPYEFLVKLVHVRFVYAYEFCNARSRALR